MPSGELLRRILLWYARGPEHPAKFRVLQWLGQHVFPHEGIVAKVPPGVWLLLHPRDWIEYLLLRGESYEPLTIDFLLRNLTTNGGALLAGVSFGLHAVVAARAVGPGGVIVAVEPQPSSILRAAANLQLNGLATRVRIVAAALGDEFGLVPVKWAPEENRGTATLLDSGPGGFTAPVLPAETLWRAFDRQRFTLALLDVQGYEVRVLSALLPGHRPDVMICEADEALLRSAGSSITELVGLLTRFDYGVFDLFGRELNAPHGSIPENNIVAVQKGWQAVWLDAATVAGVGPG